MRYQGISLIFAALASLFAQPGLAWELLNQDIDIECVQSSNRTRINCDYRLLNADTPARVRASLDDQSLTLLNNENWPWSNAITAVLFLIDTSDPGRQNVVEANVAQLEKLLQTLPEQHIAGLATFDKEMRMLAPPGADQAEIMGAAGQIKALGMTTELYRNLLNAIETLSRLQADRKIVFLFSDGLAEDQAYFHSDVIRAAREHDVVINSLGFARSTSLSVALQTLRRISEETGGQYVEADSGLKLPAAFMQQPFQSISNGGRFTVDLENIDYGKIPAATDINLRFDSGNRTIAIGLPVQRPASREIAEQAPVRPAPVQPPDVDATEVTSAPEPVRETVTVVQQPAAKSSLDKWFLYGIPIALVVLLLLTVATLIISFIKPRERNLPQVQMGDLKPYAYLILQDESKRRYPITRTTWRIGRSKDNELSLDDNSISRRHAEIHRSQGDEFTIIDLDSLNGVFINNEKVKIEQLHEGDMVEIGDINFRFTLHGAEQLLEDTVVQKTKTPVYTH
jgi:hypothetical protein